jgi:hypothetical protein
MMILNACEATCLSYYAMYRHSQNALNDYKIDAKVKKDFRPMAKAIAREILGISRSHKPEIVCAARALTEWADSLEELV